MINNDTEPPKNNYTEKKWRERRVFKMARGKLGKCVFFNAWPLAIRRDWYTSGLTAALCGPDGRLWECTCCKVNPLWRHFGWWSRFTVSWNQHTTITVMCAWSDLILFLLLDSHTSLFHHVHKYPVRLKELHSHRCDFLSPQEQAHTPQDVRIMAYHTQWDIFKRWLCEPKRSSAPSDMISRVKGC